MAKGDNFETAHLSGDIAALKKEIARLKMERQRIATHLSACMRLIAIGEITAGVSHELNNPLSVILGFAQSLSEQCQDQDSMRSSFKTMEREALRCKRLVQGLLNFSRLPKPGIVKEDLIQVVEEALSLVETQARITQVEVHRQFEENMPMVYVDKHRIQQLMINLCSNAIGAMPTGGSLTVKMSTQRESKAKSWMEIRVSDTGVGISPDIGKKIFEPFFMTKEAGKGTGLGLSMAKDIVASHHGRIEFASTPGRGTTFTVWLPCEKVPPALLLASIKGPARDQ